MFKFLIIIILFLPSLTISLAQSLPKAKPGRIIRHQLSYSLDSTILQNRIVDVWIPSSYSRNKRYGLLIMHDGEMLYDASITWNKQTWNVDSIVSVLLDKGMIDEFIIAGVHNAGSERHSEYFPQKVFESLTNQDRDSVVAQLRVAGRSNGDFSPYSDQYVSFLADQLLPFLRKAYPLKRGSVSVGLAGSSMGGLISIYGMCERPKDFGFALCLSTHWLGSFQEDNPFPRAMLTYLEENIPSPRRHKVYMDHGDKTLDSYYGSWQLKVNDLFSKKKWGPIQFRTLVFLGKDHSEKSWSERFHLPLLFVFGTN